MKGMLYSVLHFTRSWGTDLIRGARLNHLFVVDLDFDIVELSGVKLHCFWDINLIYQYVQRLENFTRAFLVLNNDRALFLLSGGGITQVRFKNIGLWEDHGKRLEFSKRLSLSLLKRFVLILNLIW